MDSSGSVLPDEVTAGSTDFFSQEAKERTVRISANVVILFILVLIRAQKHCLLNENQILSWFYGNSPISKSKNRSFSSGYKNGQINQKGATTAPFL